MRPLRALAVALALIAAWVVWRAPVAIERIDALRTALAARTDAPEPPPRLMLALRTADDVDLCVGGVELASTPERRLPRPALATALVEDDPLPVLALRLPEARPVQTAVAPGAVRESDAEAGYRLLAAGDRRSAAVAFRRAIAAAPDDARVPQWTRQLAYLERRWSGDAYVLARGAGPAALLAVSPVLGAGQSGGSVAWITDPFAPRPLALTARAAVAHDGWGIDGDSAQLGVGLRWRPFTGTTLAVERMVAGGPAARDAWTARAAWGAGDGQRWSLYSETGVVGARRRDLYAAVQGYAGRVVAGEGRRTLSLGGGTWASVQAADTTVSRVDIGPSLRLRLPAGEAGLELSGDYRFRVAGDAAPKDGVAVTLSAFY
jgi:hypothetical protein